MRITCEIAHSSGWLSPHTQGHAILAIDLVWLQSGKSAMYCDDNSLSSRRHRNLRVEPLSSYTWTRRIRHALTVLCVLYRTE
ncbi:hypothetical protein Bxe_A3710 [Paraburkholderia xenovorans LB400]|uniref:Uncharacterized protein n=1 Tax=Paraburkholderia xenovorans (strain LB400) TaxID=266265 RepID=Q144G0_PARXL|nr:hypothetical protein Bxe_A3710 [Paraburkholderia xenovorans LB400]